jgi:hypothetical protein
MFKPLLLLFSLALILMGCQPTPVPNFILILGSGNLTLEPAASGTVNVNLERQNGFADSVTLSLVNAPTGVTASFDPATVSGNNSKFSLSVAASVAPGSYNLNVEARGGSLEKKTAVLTLTVAPPTPSFDLTLSATEASMQAGTEVQIVRANVTRLGGFVAPISLSVKVSDPGVGAFIEEEGEATEINSGFVSDIVLRAKSVLEARLVEVTVRARGNGIEKSASFTLRILKDPSLVLTFFTASTKPLIRGSSLDIEFVYSFNKGGFTNETFTVTLDNPPAGITADPLTISLASGSGPLEPTVIGAKLVLRADATAVPGKIDLRVTRTVNLSEPAGPITIAGEAQQTLSIDVVP